MTVSRSPAIEVRELTFAYPGQSPVLEKLRFTVEPGECLGVVGPNGAGKTTLFLCLSGVLAIRPGMVQVAGLDPAVSTDRPQYPSRVGIVFQNSEDQLFNSTVFEDVAFGPLNLGLEQAEVEKRVAEGLAQVGLQGVEHAVPFHLSGGEKRRVALAGVLAMRPEILLLDEPSMYLDPRGRRGIIQLLHRLPGTRMISGHDLELILELCPRVAVLDGGQLQVMGETRLILGDGALMEKHGLEVPYSLRK